MNLLTVVGKRMRWIPMYKKTAKTVETLVRLKDMERIINIYGRKLRINPKLSDIDYLIWRDQAYEPHIARFVLKNLGDDAFVDVGANIGYYTVLACNRCKVYAFEPNPMMVLRLNDNIMLNRGEKCVVVSQNAAWYKSCLINLHIDKYRPGLSQVSEESYSRRPIMTVSAVRVDSIVKEPVGILKVDVEGAEYQTLLGCSRLFNKGWVRYVIVEMRKGVTDEKITKYLTRYGYKRHDFNNSPVFDAVFYKGKLELK